MATTLKKKKIDRKPAGRRVMVKRVSQKKQVSVKSTSKNKQVAKPKKQENGKRFLVVANWKMNPGTLAEAKSLFLKIKDNVRLFKQTDIVICPPSIYFDSVKNMYNGKKISFGTQTCFTETTGSYTGEFSAHMVRSAGGDYVILGHSERRAMGETDEDVRARLEKVLDTEGLTPIVCIGEKKRDVDGEYLKVIKDQLHALFYGMSHDWLRRVVIAYEPIWAIGKTGKDAVSAHALHETSIYIRKILSEIFDKRIAIEQKILYGGSVKPENAGELIDATQVDGFLVGGASLDADEFIGIAEIVENYARK